ncbi:DMT family transporter [Shimia sagamensis]|uniref:EamA-like transporter family protein n=1 Tax=Shimia sagamensis TaxID=1566352 RepID=A0ABY1P1M6_9RHOB|nr:DMT family transporter [Shimia sagamensis]SMP21962.1 EamA-like transporter family protein [Shimia sagamensis]
MTSHIATDRAANRLGAVFMVVAMAGFAVEDAFLKAAARSLPIAQVMVLFGAGGAMVFALWLRAKSQPLAPKEVASRPMQVRVVFEIVGRLFFTLSLALTPLSSTTVILQATPLVVVAFAALVLGEQVGWRRWLAIVIGLIGVVLIVRPGGESFSWLSLLAVAGMLGFAGRDLASRAAPASLSTAVLGLYGFLAIVVAGAAYGVIWEQVPFHTPPPKALLAVVGAVACGVFAYSALMRAMRTGEVSAVTPFRYSRLLFGVALGVVVFGERLDSWMLIGSALIVLSGLVIMVRGRAAAKG